MIRAWLDRLHARRMGWRYSPADGLWVKDDACIVEDQGYWVNRAGKAEVYAPTLREAVEAAQ